MNMPSVTSHYSEAILVDNAIQSEVLDITRSQPIDSVVVNNFLLPSISMQWEMMMDTTVSTSTNNAQHEILIN